MRNFEIVRRGHYIFIQSTSYNNPINSLDQIAKELRRNKYEGSVVFDLLLATGNTSNRFLLTKFTNKKFETSFFQKTQISIRLRKEIFIYYKKNSEYLSNSILSKTVISKIINENYLDE
jgi:hypothetical protein